MTTFLRNLIAHDFWLKLFSLVLAITIWLTISFAMEGGPPGGWGARASEPVTLFDVPILKVSSAADVRDFNVFPPTVDISVRGDREALAALKEGTSVIRPQVDLTGIGSGQQIRKRIDVILPPGITLVQVNPEEVDIIVPLKR